MTSTIELVEILQAEPRPYFYTAVVEAIRADGLLDLVIGSVGDPDLNVARFTGVAYLESYVPQVYDKVFFMTHQTRKSLVFGKAYDGSTTSLARADVALGLESDWELTRGRAVRRSGVAVLNVEVRSPDPVLGDVIGHVIDRRARPRGVPATVTWAAGALSGGGEVDDETGAIELHGAVPAAALILVSAVWDTIGGTPNGQ